MYAAVDCGSWDMYRGADKSLVQPGRKQARKHVRDPRDFNNIETRAVIKFFSCKARRRRIFTPFRQKHYLVSFLAGLRTYQHQWRTQQFCSGGGSTNSVEDIGQTERGSWGCRPPSQGFWRQLYFGTRNFISYNKIFLISDTLSLFMMTTNLFVIAKVKQLRTGGSFRILRLFPEHFRVLAS